MKSTITTGEMPQPTNASRTCSAMPAAISITHQHLLACVNTLLSSDAANPVRLLDVGCGNGELIAYISAALPVLRPGCRVEVHGLDVGDSGVQASGFFARTVANLSARLRDVDWTSRLSLVTSADAWPYPDGYFDLVLSNQVLEHVADHGLFFDEIRRTLKDGCYSVHLFPLVHYIQEGHIHIPLAHRIRRHGLLRSYIKVMSRIGFGSFREHRDQYGMSLDQYAEEHADYLTFMTNYLTGKELLQFAKRSQLRADFRFTGEFYRLKLRSLLKRPPQFRYAQPKPWTDALAFTLYKRVSSITLVLEKRQSYAR